MTDPDLLLARALDAAARRYRLPPLPADAESARTRGPQVALAFAIEAARSARASGTAPPQAIVALFLEALADLVRAALTPAGDPAFQALLLQADDAAVREYVLLQAQAGADRRGVRAVVDALAHPGKLRTLADGPARIALERLHAQATAQHWQALRETAAQLSTQGAVAGQAALQRLLADPALARLQRLQALQPTPSVQRYETLVRRRGPEAGSDAAVARGRASAHLGAQAEAATVAAFTDIARLLAEAGGPGPYRVVQGLRLPRGFPGAGRKAKEEWDVALLRGEPVARLVLLAEVKASPAAATPDLPRLLRGLHRLAQAETATTPVFPHAGGEVRIAADSLQRLQPTGHALPPGVIYCCTAPPEDAPVMLAAAAQAVLLAEPTTLSFAGALAAGAHPSAESLAPVWQALASAPRLRSALHQFETAQTVRAAMLQPQDLVAALQAVAAR